MKRVSLSLAALVMLMDTAQAMAGPVRVPRDSPIVMHGRVVSSGPLAVSTVAPGSRAGSPSRPSCRTHVFPDPGYRAIWVPDTTCWTGFEAIRVPGHWQGPGGQ
jgi:hypothetical protein